MTTSITVSTTDPTTDPPVVRIENDFDDPYSAGIVQEEVPGMLNRIKTSYVLETTTTSTTTTSVTTQYG